MLTLRPFLLGNCTKFNRPTTIWWSILFYSILFARGTNSPLSHQPLHYLFSVLIKCPCLFDKLNVFSVSLKSQTIPFLFISGDCHVYINFIIARTKHLNRNSIAHPHPQLWILIVQLCLVNCSPSSRQKHWKHFRHFVAWSAWQPGQLHKNQLPLKLTLQKHRTFPRDSSIEINSQRNITLLSKKNPYRKVPTLAADKGSNLRRGGRGWRRRFIHRTHHPPPALERGPLYHFLPFPSKPSLYPLGSSGVDGGWVKPS